MLRPGIPVRITGRSTSLISPAAAHQPYPQAATHQPHLTGRTRQPYPTGRRRRQQSAVGNRGTHHCRPTSSAPHQRQPANRNPRAPAAGCRPRRRRAASAAHLTSPAPPAEGIADGPQSLTRVPACAPLIFRRTRRRDHLLRLYEHLFARINTSLRSRTYVLMDSCRSPPHPPHPGHSPGTGGGFTARASAEATRPGPSGPSMTQPADCRPSPRRR
jgi:hypothetical protein